MPLRSLLGVVAGAMLLPAHAAAPDPKPITTLATLEASSLFSGLDLALDSTASSATVRVYRSSVKPLARRTGLRVYLTSRGEVMAVRFGIAPPALRQAGLLLRDPIGGFMAAAVAPADSAAFATTLVQVRDDFLGAESDTAFLARDTANALMPRQPSAMYLAFLNRRATAEESHGASRLQITNAVNGADTATVITIAPVGMTLPALVAAEWVAKPEPEILGGTLADFEQSVLAEGTGMQRLDGSGSTHRYIGLLDRDTAMTVTLTLDAMQRISRAALTMRHYAAMLDADASMEAGVVISGALGIIQVLVPVADSAAVKAVRRAAVLELTDADGVRAQQLHDVMTKRQAQAVFEFGMSSVLATRTGTDDLTLTVGPAGAFAAAPATSGRRP